MIKNKKVVTSIVIFIIFALFVTLININNTSISYDRIWVYHMLQKVANGEQMYTEINILVGPIFYFLGGLFLKIFGTNFITYDILGGIMYGILATLIYNITLEINEHKNKFINIFMLVVSFYFAKFLCLANYNNLSIIFILFVILIEIRKAQNKGGKFSNYLIGAFLGLSFFTKQTTGGIAIIATGLISIIDGIVKKESPIKEILEKASGFFIILIPIVSLMIFNGIFLDYIDLCFGSILEFGQNNNSLGNVTIYMSLMTAVPFATFCIWKNKKEDKELLLITVYAIALLFFMYPIFNNYHVHVATIIGWFLIIKILNICLENKAENLFKLIPIMMLVIFIISIYTFDVTDDVSKIGETEIGLKEIKNLVMNITDIAVMCFTGYALVKEDYKKYQKNLIICTIIATSFFTVLYCKSLEGKETPLGLEIYANHGIENEKLNEISDIVKYVETKENEGYKVLGISWDASEYFAPMNRNNNKYDLLFYGNLGYKGVDKVLNEIKEMENVIFLKNKEDFWQEPEEIREYIINNCEKIDEIHEVEVYKK